MQYFFNTIIGVILMWQKSARFPLYRSSKINIQAIDAKHDRSMREVYGLKGSESR